MRECILIMIEFGYVIREIIGCGRKDRIRKLRMCKQSQCDRFFFRKVSFLILGAMPLVMICKAFSLMCIRVRIVYMFYYLIHS
jgi:hypothetical protein